MTEKPQIEPLPCPFCGSKPKIEQGKIGHCQLHGDPFQSVIVKCRGVSPEGNTCVARPKVEGGDIHNGGFQQARDKAVEMWNRRAS